MPINVFGNSSSSHDNGNKIDTSIFVQDLYLGTNYFVSNIEEDFDMKNQYKNRNLPYHVENSDAVCKSYVDGGLNHRSIIRNIAQVDFIGKNLDNARFVKISSLPAVREHLTPKFTTIKLFLIAWISHHC